ncbi:LysM repeat-containing protein [Natronincola peptidivorans]|uniref:LysM repeat-containing protein n=1 Tax=Natronincola peptidivorans TaxID=426128 RepID=A0A1I0BI89_9FIRM|nr:LysM peptidoglycan-binding domain-containing protein [Natronincola peptidivorans]SET05952.1 LysM repeat-containing protein [Natronincola peptidivorans]
MNSKFKKMIIGTALASAVFTSTFTPAFASSLSHRVVSGDTLWKISQKYQVSLEEIYNLNPQYRNNPEIRVGDTVQIPGKQQSTYTVQRNDTPWIISNKFNISLKDFLSANGLREGQHIYPGQQVIIPSTSNNSTAYVVQRNDTPWIISNKFNVSLKDFLSANGLREGQHIYPGQTVTIPSSKQQTAAPTNPPSTATPRKTFTTHTVVSGDTTWNISIKYGIPFKELLDVNGLRENHVLRIGDKLTIPVYNIPVKETPGPQYGELLDWWTEAQYVVPIGKEFAVVDFHTGRRWNMKRTIGANHADVEPVTARDASIMKEVWGGSYSWNRRPVIVEVDGRRLAASASAMPHDVQYINNNNFNGHSDLYFLNSTRHVDGRRDEGHQNNVLTAAGQK